VIFVVITVKIRQGFFLVPPLFDSVSSIFHPHLHAAVIDIKSWRGLVNFESEENAFL
jgi:hypothetical protein